MKKIVFDTNILFSMQKGIDLGATTEEVINSIIRSITTQNIQFITSPKIIEEINSFFEQRPLPDSLIKLYSLITIASPNNSTQVPHFIMTEFLEDVRKRMYNGLKVSEDILISVINNNGKILTEDYVEFQKKTGEYIQNLRARYRNATRVGSLDSVSDFELILLAKQYNAKLLTTDSGLLQWARKLGVEELPTQCVNAYLFQTS